MLIVDLFIKMLLLIDFLAYSLCFSNQVCWLSIVWYLKKWFSLGQIWGNLISYLVLKPKEIEVNGTITTLLKQYDKCGADFKEQEYKDVEIINQVDRKTVEKTKYSI